MCIDWRCSCSGILSSVLRKNYLTFKVNGFSTCKYVQNNNSFQHNQRLFLPSAKKMLLNGHWSNFMGICDILAMRSLIWLSFNNMNTYKNEKCNRCALWFTRETAKEGLSVIKQRRQFKHQKSPLFVFTKEDTHYTSAYLLVLFINSPLATCLMRETISHAGL